MITKLLGIIMLSIGFSSSNESQQACGVRYTIEQNFLKELIIKNPEKKSKIESRLKISKPAFLDYYIWKNSLIETYWREDSSLYSVKIYSNDLDYIINLNKSGELTTDEYDGFGNIKYEKTEEKNFQFATYDSDEILKIKMKFKSDSLNIITNYLLNDKSPECDFINQNKVFPIKVEIGSPKPMITFHSEKVIKSKNIELFKRLIEEHKSQRKSKKLLQQFRM